MGLRSEMGIISQSFVLLVGICSYMQGQTMDLIRDGKIFKKYDNKGKMISTSLLFMNYAAREIEPALNEAINDCNNYLVIQRYKGYDNARHLALIVKSKSVDESFNCYEWMYTEKKWKKVKEFNFTMNFRAFWEAVPVNGKFALNALIQDGHLYLFSYRKNGEIGYSGVYGSVENNLNITQQTRSLLMQVWSIRE